MKIRNKLMLGFLACGIAPLAIVGTLAFSAAQSGLSDVQEEGLNAIESQATSQLVAVRDIKREQIARYFEERRADLAMLTESVGTILNAIERELTEIQRQQTHAITRHMSQIGSDIAAQQDRSICTAGMREYRHFHQTGESTAERDRYHGIIRNFISSTIYTDLLIFDELGTCVESALRDNFFGRNILKEHGENTPLGRAFTRAAAGETVFVDLGTHRLNQESTDGFVLAPINDAGQTTGVVALRFPAEPIIEILENGPGQPASQTTFIAGRNPDQTISLRTPRTDGRTTQPIGQPVTSDAIRRAIAGQSGSTILPGPDQNTELSIFSSISVGNLQWGLVTTVKLEEYFTRPRAGETNSFLAQFMEAYSYYDIFLISPDGHCFYTVVHESDYQTNLLTGRYKDSNLGRLTADVIRDRRFVFKDFEPYAPSNGDQAAFFGQPLIQNGGLKLVVAMQIPEDGINSIMHTRAGMGKTGHSYLIAVDHAGKTAFRSDMSAMDARYVIGFQVSTPYIEQAVQTNQSGQGSYVDSLGIGTLAAYEPVRVFDNRWYVITKMDTDEALAAQTAMNERAGGAMAMIFSQTLVVGLVAGLLVAVIAVMIARKIAGPLAGMVHRFREIAMGDGDLTQRLDAHERDELGQLGGAFNLFVGKVHDVIVAVRGSSDELADAAREIAAGSEELSSGMRSQDDQLAQVSAAVEEMSASIREVAEKALGASNSAGESGKVAEEGGRIVEDTVSGMVRIKDTVNHCARSVEELGKLGDQIGEVITVINDIADQTNLLALNAAIEAARAGEHGRGFAVVADEVRKLADRTTKATEEIGHSIQSIQDGTAKAVTEMHAGTREVESGVEQAQSAGQSLRSIMQSTREVSSMVQSIAAAAEEQSAASQQVAGNVEAMASMNREATMATTHAAEASLGMAEKTRQLTAMIERFKLNARERRENHNGPPPGEKDRRVRLDRVVSKMQAQTERVARSAR